MLAVPVAAQEADPFWLGWAGGALGALLVLDHWVCFDRVGHKVLFIKLSLYALVP